MVQFERRATLQNSWTSYSKHSHGLKEHTFSPRASSGQGPQEQTCPWVFAIASGRNSALDDGGLTLVVTSFLLNIRAECLEAFTGPLLQVVYHISHHRVARGEVAHSSSS
jgi:hypothetical protein